MSISSPELKPVNHTDITKDEDTKREKLINLAPAQKVNYGGWKWVFLTILFLNHISAQWMTYSK
jgi:hypothetical protein